MTDINRRGFLASLVALPFFPKLKVRRRSRFVVAFVCEQVVRFDFKDWKPGPILTIPGIKAEWFPL